MQKVRSKESKTQKHMVNNPQFDEQIRLAKEGKLVYPKEQLDHVDSSSG